MSGIGVHSGVKSNIKILPADENHGIKFKRIDLPDKPIIDADIKHVSSTERSTTLSHNGIEIKTLEHLLAALYGNNIDNALIEIDAQEVPILDGSAKELVQAIKKAGIKEQKAEKLYYEITEPVTFENKETGSSFIALPSDRYQITSLVSFCKDTLKQHATIEDISEFNEEVSKARTFCFLSEIRYLLANNLIKGGDLHNALVIIDQDLSKEEEAILRKSFNLSDDIKINSGNKILGAGEFRYENELARHKLLDVIGDLALLGRPIKGHIIAKKPGHKANTRFAQELRKIFNGNDYRSYENYIPKYDPNKPPVFDTNQIFNILPQKPPFLMVDKIIELTDHHIVGIKNTTINESFYTGHFPNEPILPGVLQIEAMAQTAGILTYHIHKEALGAPTYLAKVEEAKFKRKITPGDTLIIYCSLKTGLKRGIIYMQSKIFVGSNIASEGIIVAKTEL